VSDRPARGDLARDTDVRPAVARAWGAGYSSIALLYAGRNLAGQGPEPIVVVATAHDGGGRPRIGWFTASGRDFTATAALVRRAETAGPAATDVYELGTVVELPSGWVAFDLAAPGYTVAVPSVPGEDLPPGVHDPQGEFVQRPVDGPKTVVTVLRGGQPILEHDLG
jgi:hypothetical protein